MWNNIAMGKQDDTASKLKAIRESAGVSIREMARRVGMSTSGYIHYESPDRFKGRFLPLETAQTIARSLLAEGIDPADVMALAGVAAPDAGGGAERLHQINDMVPIYDVHASAGSGAVTYEEDAVASLAFPPGYLRKLTNAHVGNLKIITVKGDSMIPTLNEDDVVMLDVSKVDLSYDGLYVFRDGGDALMVKRIGRASRIGHVMIISDNQSLYPTIERSLADIEIVGRVIWSGGKL